MLLRILLCLPEPTRQEHVRKALGRRALVTRAANAEELWDALRGDVFDLAILSADALSPDPLASLRTILGVSDGPDVILIAPGDPEAISAYLAAGCLAVLDAGLGDGDLIAALEAVTTRASSTRDRRVVANARIDRRIDAMGTSSPAIRRFQDVTRRIAAGDSPVLIQGEPGTGKTWLGPVIHRESPRASGAFHSLRCSDVEAEALEVSLFGHAADALPGPPAAERGILERAHRGTLFLERIDGSPLSFQLKLLRYLDEGRSRRVGGQTWSHVDVRLLASVGDDPAAHVEAGTLHPDLYRRIGLVNLTPPPLRDRPEDVAELALSAHHKCSARYGLAVQGFTAAALEVLQQHTWPGNVSELWSVVERSTLLCRGERITVEDLPPDIVSHGEGRSSDGFLVLDAPWLHDSSQLPTLRELQAQSLEVVERAYLTQLLKSVYGRVAEAARRAEVDPRSVYQRMRRFGLRKEDFKLPRPPLRRKPRDT